MTQNDFVITGKKHLNKIRSKAVSSCANDGSSGVVSESDIGIENPNVVGDIDKEHVGTKFELQNPLDEIDSLVIESDMDLDNLSIELDTDSDEEMQTEDKGVNDDLQFLLDSGYLSKDNGIRWGSCYPMAGGGDLGYKEAFKSDPLFFITDNDFKKNQKHVKQLFPMVPQFTMEQFPDIFKNGDMHVVTCICPCAGLSSLNNSKGSKKPGSEALQNDYMKNSLKFVLSEVKPAVFVGENSDKLFTCLGSELVQELVKIGNEYGYACSLYMTCTSQHGLPQKRKRTFYIFWKSGKVSRLGWVSNGHPELKEFLDRIPADATLQDVFVNSKKPTHYKPYQILLELCGKTHGTLKQSNPTGQTVFTHLQKMNLLDKVTEILDSSDTVFEKLKKLAAK